MITAQEAHRIGLVNEVTAPAELIPRAEAIAQKIIANAPLAVQYAMEAVNKGMEMTLADGLYLEAVLFCRGLRHGRQERRDDGISGKARGAVQGQVDVLPRIHADFTD